MLQMKSRKVLYFSLLIIILIGTIISSKATNSDLLNNFVNDYEIDGFVNSWYNNQTDHQYLSARFDSSIHRIITGVRMFYRTTSNLAPLGDCNVSYKFESGEYVYYDDVLPNTNGDNKSRAFYCQGDTFLITDSTFYVDFACESDDPYIQVGTDKDHSGHSMYSLNGGPWTTDNVEYLMEAIVEDILTIDENTIASGIITNDTDFVDCYHISLTTHDTCNFYLKSLNASNSFNMRFFNLSTRLTRNSDALWIENGSTAEKSKNYDSQTGEYLLLVEPHEYGNDTGTYQFYWTYNPESPDVVPLNPIDDDGNIQLSWNSSPDSDIIYYNIYRGTSPNFPLDVAHMISTPGSITGNSFEDMIWLPDGQYYYLVTSVDQNGQESNKSNVVNTTVTDSTAPKEPTLIDPTDHSVDDDGIILLNWNISDEGDIQYHRLYRSIYSGFPLNSTHLISTTTNGSFVDFLSHNSDYYYRVTSVDDNNNEGNGSNEVMVIFLDSTEPMSPSKLTCNIYGDIIILNWSRSVSHDVVQYIIYRDTAPIIDVSNLTAIANTTCTNWSEPLPVQGTYYYAVLSVDANGLISSIFEATSIMVSPPTSYIPIVFLFVMIGAFISVFSIGAIDRHRRPDSIFNKANKKNLKKIMRKFIIKLEKIKIKNVKTITLSLLYRVRGYFFTFMRYLIRYLDKILSKLKNKLQD